MRRALLFSAALCIAGAAEARLAGSDDPGTAWQRYLAQDTGIEPDYRFPHANCFRSASRAHDIPETLLLAVARGESDFDASARSRANAHGVMQIQWPETARHLGIYRLSQLYDPCTNIEAGARYLKELMVRYDNDLHLALAAYNYGPGRIKKSAASIPSGATWYSGYIYRHLDYVLGDRSNDPAVASLYSDIGHTVLLSFGEPYRAAAFVERMEARSDALRLDWFRKGVGRFDVVLNYASKDEYEASAARLRASGFPIR